MEVEMLGFIRRAAGEGRVEVDASTVGQLITTLVTRYGEGFSQELTTAEGNLRTGVAVLINGRNVDFLQGLNTPLNPGDRVTIIPPVAGG